MTGLVGTVFAAMALAMPQTDLAAATGLAPVSEQRADFLAQTALASKADRVQAIMETRRSLGEAPANPTAWLRLAYLDSLSEAGLSTGGEAALAASYAVAPFGPDVSTWRLSFALNHWPALSDDTRRAALSEIRVTAGYVRHRRLMRSISDPAGRLALRLTLDTLEREEAARRSVG